MLTPRAGQPAAVESVDYQYCVNAVSSSRRAKEQQSSRHVWGYSGVTLIKLLTTVLCGVATGAAAVALESSIELLVRKRNLAFQALHAQHSLLLAVASPVTTLADIDDLRATKSVLKKCATARPPAHGPSVTWV